MKKILLISLVIVLSYQTVEYNTFDEPFAKHLFYLTSASYCSEQHIRNWNCGKPCKELKPITDVTIFVNATNENAGYGAYHPETDEIYLVFRGTLPWSITNWIEDIDFIKTDYPYCPNNCQVHRGFYYSFLGIQDQVLNTLKSLTKKYPLAKITITGHSLGGALAHHALVYLATRGFTISKFYTFGSPRVGDKNFFTYVNQQLFPGPKFRVTHNHDPVPHLPALIQGFHHVNQEAYYKDYLLVIHKKVQLCNDSLKEDDSCSNANLVDLSVSDHANYMGYDMTLELLTCQ
ncbi:unnamed protein product [Paramecium octaurelia]|uniref:Fungal lipase-type domain-containing protein n=1 Tax=Paramecium octaurelia TaxID=43137 RepID=A0A8S1VIZ8_PAROT|nr:unnamed protein product [Paramecium octaurelia]